ncbi:hypothetical protein JCGZ_14242 [Jatropha curcas]|uniref:Uncharacterized protein n=1 Tax=Jatropha curcas TaxID=180498 RepID=A0A067JWX1_JATCU|nr:hypothetical protein JCGZ_14242 [Jatropha curcas]
MQIAINFLSLVFDGNKNERPPVPEYQHQLGYFMNFIDHVKVSGAENFCCCDSLKAQPIQKEFASATPIWLGLGQTGPAFFRERRFQLERRTQFVGSSKRFSRRTSPENLKTGYRGRWQSWRSLKFLSFKSQSLQLLALSLELVRL